MFLNSFSHFLWTDLDKTRVKQETNQQCRRNKANCSRCSKLQFSWRPSWFPCWQPLLFVSVFRFTGNLFISWKGIHPPRRGGSDHEKEFNHSLPFLDVLVERLGSEFSTSVYRKPTCAGQYLRWNSFSSHKRKINLIGTLVHRAFMICSKGELDPELDKIRSILLKNGYPEHSINSTLKRKLQQLNSSLVHTVKNAQSTYTFHG